VGETGGADQHHNHSIENHDTSDNDNNENCDGGVVSSSKWDRVKINVKVMIFLFRYMYKGSSQRTT
jgi:hypothetical protein